MIVRTALLPLLLVGSPAQSGWTTSIPPVKFRADAMATVAFVADPDGRCAPPDDVRQYRACVVTYPGGAQLMVLPNPCKFASVDFYARWACHELGHRNGWPANHKDVRP